MKEKDKEPKLPLIPFNMNENGLWGMPFIDPFGSYTGVPIIPTEQPIQDADDL